MIILSQSRYIRDRVFRWTKEECYICQKKTCEIDYKPVIPYNKQQLSLDETHSRSPLWGSQLGQFNNFPSDCFGEVFKWFRDPRYAFSNQWTILRLVCRKWNEMVGVHLSWEFYVQRALSGEVKCGPGKFKSEDMEHMWMWAHEIREYDLSKEPAYDFAMACIEGNCNAALSALARVAKTIPRIGLADFMKTTNPLILNQILDVWTYDRSPYEALHNPAFINLRSDISSVLISTIIKNKTWRSKCLSRDPLILLSIKQPRAVAALYKENIVKLILSFSDWPSGSDFLKGIAYVLFPVRQDFAFLPAIDLIVNDSRTKFDTLPSPPPSIYAGSEKKLIHAYMPGFLNEATLKTFRKYTGEIRSSMFKYVDIKFTKAYLSDNNTATTMEDFLNVVLRDPFAKLVWDAIPKDERNQYTKKFKAE
jgi:hypothetical protein